MIISVTERGTFKRCRALWDYTSMNRQGLAPIVTKPALDLGTLIHKAHESWLTGQDDIVSAFAKAAKLNLARVQEEYRERVGANIDQREFEPYLNNVTLGLEMVKNYKEKWVTPLPSNFTLIQPEQEVHVPIPGTERPCTNCNGSKWQYEYDNVAHPEYGPKIACKTCEGTGTEVDYLEGKFDGLVQDEKERLYVLEHKTYGQHPNQDDLNENDQFLAYIWIVSQLQRDAFIGGIFYDGMWKRPSPPKNWKFDDLFHRQVLFRSKFELDNFEKLLPIEASQMRDPQIYLNVPWNGCGDCDVRKLCVAQRRGEDTEYVKRVFYKPRKDKVNELQVA